MFFFEKKNQKTFFPFGRSLTQAAVTDSERQEQKFFASFFQKRSPSLLFPFSLKSPQMQVARKG